MTTIGRAWRGTWCGIMAAAVTFPFVVAFQHGPRNLFEAFLVLCVFAYALPVLAILAGPGAFLLSWIHALQMESWCPHAVSVAQIRRVSVLLGLPLGVANLVLVFAVGLLLHGKSLNWTASMLPLLVPALAGGLGLGWGVTAGLIPGNARRTQIVRPALRRDGPPFFDNRATHPHRRAA